MDSVGYIHDNSLEVDILISQHLRILQKSSEECDAALKSLEKAAASVESLKHKQQFVIGATNALNSTCQDLSKEQTKLNEVIDEIEATIKPFDRLMPMGKLLGLKVNPHAAFAENSSFSKTNAEISVFSSQFANVLSELDECIDFCSNHPEYRDSFLYLRCFEQLLVHGLQLARDEVARAMKVSSSQASTRLQSQEGEIPIESAALYTSAHLLSAQLAPIIRVIECRHARPEAVQLSRGCRRVYVECRKILLSSIIESQCPAVIPIDELSDQIRKTCVFLFRLSSLEQQTFQMFFNTEECDDDTREEMRLDPNSKDTRLDPQLHSMLSESFAWLPSIASRSPLDNSWESLQSLCSSAQVTLSEVLSSMLKGKGAVAAPLELAVRDLLSNLRKQIVSTSLSFMSNTAQNHEDCGKYIIQPFPGIVAHLTPLLPSTERRLKRKEEFEAHFTVPTATTKKPPFETLQVVSTGLSCLAITHRCLSTESFESVAAFTLPVCLKAISDTSAEIITRGGSIHSGLFLLRHLLWLRDQLTPFDLRFSQESLDAANIGGGPTIEKVVDSIQRIIARLPALLSFTDDNPLFSDNPLEGLWSDGTSHNPKETLEQDLRKACITIIDNCSQSCVHSVVSLLTQLSNFNRKDLVDSAMLHPDSLELLLSELCDHVPMQFSLRAELLGTYLDPKTSRVLLLKPIKTNISDCLLRFKQLILRLPEIRSKLPSNWLSDLDFLVEWVLKADYEFDAPPKGPRTIGVPSKSDDEPVEIPNSEPI